MSVQKLNIKILDGPSTIAPCPALVAEFSYQALSPRPPAPVSEDFIHALETVLDGLEKRPALKNKYSNHAELVAEVTAGLISLNAPGSLQGYCRLSGQERVSITLEYFFPHLAAAVLQCVINIVSIMLSGRSDQRQLLNQQRDVLQRNMRIYDPGWNNISMMASAAKLDIPFFPADEGMRFYCYGQGAKSRLFYESASDLDSLVGRIATVNKASTVQMLTSMGYPVPRQVVVLAREHLGPVVKQLGYPLVVKPVTGSKGTGVTSNIWSEDDLVRAFEHADKQTPRQVVIEKHVEGFDHRLTVASGQLVGANLKKPPMVTGDGIHTIGQLISRENESRPAELKRQGLIKDIVVDEITTGVLNAQSMTLASIPEKGRIVRLRTNANLATGGSIESVLDRVHPDNARMAVDIARNLRLDVIGIDFITTDIARSWHEEGAVIEVNCTPGVMNMTAEKVLMQHFPDDTRGRIRSSLYLSGDTDLSDPRFGFDLGGRNIGYTNSYMTLLNGTDRKLEQGKLLKRCRALLLDPDCDEIIIVMSVDELLKKGLPLDRFDAGYVDERLLESEDSRHEVDDGGRCRELLARHCGTIDFF
jgi:cyanophycin synthetase